MTKPLVEYRRITDPDDAAYRDFLIRKDSPEEAELFLARVRWYFRADDYVLWTAAINGKIIAHAGAYKVTARLNGRPMELWWGVDTFALKECRGLGIGKELQRRLHQLPNFSSQAYSRINGNIKLRLGCKPLLRTHFVYYPVSRFVSPVVNMVANKLLHRSIQLPSFGRNKYLALNRCSSVSRKFDIRPICGPIEFETYKALIDKGLSRHDFYIERSAEYLDWKYNQNPSMTFKAAEVRDTRSYELIALVLFTEPMLTSVYLSKLNVSLLLDYFSADAKKFGLKEALQVAAKCLKDCDKTLDGICALGRCSYFPSFSYPRSGRPLLSTIHSRSINNQYISYSDQDMEQAY